MERGFTLLELIVVLAIITILTTLAVPGYGTWVRSTRIDTAANRLATLLATARSEAVRRGGRVTLCRSDDGTACTGSARQGKYIWTGALLFHDQNRNRLRDDEEERIRVLDLGDGAEVIWNRGESTVYKGDGSLLGGANGSFFIVDHNDLTTGIRLVAQMTGRVRRAGLRSRDLESLRLYLDNRSHTDF